MTYLRLHVCQATSHEENEGQVVADFMIDEHDPRECVRRALAALRKNGWQVLVLINAEHGSTPDDFQWGRRFDGLFSEAKASGIAFSVTKDASAAGLQAAMA